MGAEEVQVDEQQVHLGVADALADAEGGGVDAVDAGLDRGEAVGEPEAAVAVAVPVELHLLAAAADDLILHEAHEGADAVGGRVADGVGEAEAARAPADRVPVEGAQRLGVGAGGVLGDEHHRQPLADGEGDRGLARAEEVVERPVLGVLADGRGADEGRGLDRDPGRLRDAHDRLDVGLHGARGAVGGERELLLGDLAREVERVGARARAGAGEADVGGGDAERDHQVEQRLLVLDGGIGDRRTLQAIAQRLIVRAPRGRRSNRRRRGRRSSRG